MKFLENGTRPQPPTSPIKKLQVVKRFLHSTDRTVYTTKTALPCGERGLHSAKRANIRLIEPYVLPKQPYLVVKEAHILSKELYIRPIEPNILPT